MGVDVERRARLRIPQCTLHGHHITTGSDYPLIGRPVMPKRVQQRRSKGWRKPDGAISVARLLRLGRRVSKPVDPG